MKRKPWAIIILALIHVLAPIGNLIFNAWRSGRTLSEQWHYWFHILPKHLLLIYLLIPVLAGIFIYICRRWSYWAYLGCLLVIFLSNVYGFLTSMSTMNFVFLCVTLVVDLLVVAYFVVPSVRKVYFDPRVRWWETAPRYIFSPTVVVNGHKAKMNNISIGGLFVADATSLEEGQDVAMEWSYNNQDYKATGKVVYKNARAQGYGVRFSESSESDPSLKKLISLLDAEGKIVPDRLPGPDDTFMAWLKKLVIRREGLFPKS
ncbi:PilZ domain protein [compost metagenome]